MSWKFPGLERTSQIAFIVMCAAVTAVGVQRLTASRAVAPSPPPPIAAGTKLSLHPDLAPGSARASLVVALSTTCQFCTASMPFYRRLADLEAARGGRLRLGVLSMQSNEAMRAYMADHGLAVRAVVPIGNGGIPVQATPTLVIFNSSGAVTRSWAGRLRPDDEDAVLKEIARLTAE